MISSNIRICYDRAETENEYTLFYCLCDNDDAYITIAKSMKEAIDFMSTVKNFLGPYVVCDRIVDLSFLSNKKKQSDTGPEHIDTDVIQSTSHGIKDLHIYRCTPDDLRKNQKLYIAESQKLLFDYLESIGESEKYSSVHTVDFYNFSKIKGLFLVPSID